MSISSAAVRRAPHAGQRPRPAPTPLLRVAPSTRQAARSSKRPATIHTRLQRVAWLAIAIGVAMEAAKVIALAIVGRIPGVEDTLLILLRTVAWTSLVCVGLAVGKAFAQGRPAWAGLAGLLAGSVSFYAAAALQRSLAAVILHADLPPGVLSPIVVAAIKAVEYGWLGAAVVWLERRNRGGLAAHALVGLATGAVFGVLTLALQRLAAVPLTAPLLLGLGVNELVFPLGCALILYVVEKVEARGSLGARAEGRRRPA